MRAVQPQQAYIICHYDEQHGVVLDSRRRAEAVMRLMKEEREKTGESYFLDGWHIIAVRVYR